ncbi:FAD/NAD(P)-binding protein [Desulfobacula phenolica]|uniref:NAD(P)H-flavin reductase n=1 Tax=Desulfobacula phenolica TaxID=90732 RepID=A0A1H2HU05_9BACT|nr:FAD/NAD(P)-binding protein [Desulfobacula phenolica]SDU35373.1 NAD(P)H-flavin reductase [Desulfobacula phenolica]
MKNPYKPFPVKIEDIKTETHDRSLKTFTFIFDHKEDENAFSYTPGQFAMLSIPCVGEIPIGIASAPCEQGAVKFTVFKTGKVTSFLHNMKKGDEMGIRGPFGNGFPLKEMKDKNLLIIGGGFAFTTLRSLIKTLLQPGVRKDFNQIDVVYGARNPGMLLYREELADWNKRDDIHMHITVDTTDDENWPYHTGFIPTVVQECVPRNDNNTMAIVCGPPVMIKFTRPVLTDLDYSDEEILMSLENRMKCGIGMCGRCNIGKELVCKDGPVFTLEQINRTPGEF